MPRYLLDIAFVSLLHLKFRLPAHYARVSLCPQIYRPLSDVKYFFMTRKSYGQLGECACTFSTRQKINTLRPEIEFERVNRPAAYYSVY